MAKRPAQDSLETVTDSPASKKARVQDVPDEDLPLPPPPTEPEPVPTPREQAHTNGNGTESHATAKSHVRSEDALDEDDEDYDEPALGSRKAAPDERYSDLYLDTISRKNMDFDFEKLCSITLSNINVYACLVCGKYFSGRGPKTPAYFHALEVGHHVYINMETKKVYVLPEGYEVKSKSLDDIKVVVDPRFTPEEARTLDKKAEPSWDLLGRKYIPGFVGLNNIKANDYLNVVVQALSHVPPLRNFFMLEDLSSKPQLVQRFSTLVRKIWNPRAFKNHVSPHELLQEIGLRSSKKFFLTEQADPVEFLSWFLNHLHLALGGSKTKPRSSLIQQIFQGMLRIESQGITARADAGDRLRFEDAAIKSQTTPFTILTLDLPPAPLFQDDAGKNIIPQVPLTTILQKYNGVTGQEKLNTRMRYRLLHPLPPYLIMHVKRFQPNKFLQSQRNPTIVTFNPRALDFSPYVEPNPQLHPTGEPIAYDLVANITYEGVKVRDDSVEGEAERKVWKVHVREGGDSQQWWEMQDLFVDKVNADLLATKESYIMVWERRKTSTKGKGRANSKTFRECDVTYVPIFLGGVMQACGNTPPINIKNKAEWIGVERLRWSKQFNIAMCQETPEPFPQLTLNAMRALCAVTILHPDRLSDCFAAMYQAFWVDRKSISKTEVWSAALVEVLGESEAKKVVEKASSAEAKKVLKDNSDFAFAEGAFGLPWFVATNSDGVKEGFWGFDHLGQVIDHLGLSRQNQGFRAML
ncbi:Ubiquitin carboxyl-terminal hydrolase 10 [Elasticomyces elasticus]|nr:Ubiquitin carboxyl-terminal hydrolase 10 [Elasticomyces elasticus]